MKEWHRQARQMYNDGRAIGEIVAFFGVCDSAVRYAVFDDEREATRRRIDKQKETGSRAAICRRYEEKNRDSISIKKAARQRKRRERVLSIAREYGCGDAV